MQQIQATSEVIELQARINYLGNELAIRNEEIGFLKASLQQLEAQKEVLTRNLEDSRHEGEYLTSRYKAESKVLKKDFEELEKKLERRAAEVRKLKTIVDEKNKEIESWQEKHKELQMAVADREEIFKRTCGDYKTKISELEKAAKKFKMQIRTAEEFKASKTEQSKQAKSDAHLLRAELKEAHRLQESLTKKLESEVRRGKDLKEELESKSRDVQELSNRYRELEQRLQEADESANLQRQRLAREQTAIQTSSLQSLQDQHDKIVKFYNEQLSGMKTQLDRYRSSQEKHSARTANPHEQRQRVLVEMLINCLCYDLPYVNLIDAQKEFKEHPELHCLFDKIRCKLEQIETLKLTAEQLTKENVSSSEKMSELGLEILDLTQQLRMKEKEHQQNYQAVRQELAEYVSEHEAELSRLQRQLHDRNEQISLLRAENAVIERSNEQLVKPRNTYPEDLLEVNHVNAALRVKLIGLGSVIEVLLALLAQCYRQADLNYAKLKYYRIYEGFYWRLRNTPIVKQQVVPQSRPGSTPKRKLKKLLTSVLFVKTCELKMRRSLVLSSSSTFSQLSKQIGDGRLSNGLSKQTQQQQKLVVNTALEELKKDGWTTRSKIDWVVQLVKQERLNLNAVATYENRQSSYPTTLFARQVDRFREILEGLLHEDREIEVKRSAVADRSAAFSNVFCDLRQQLVNSRNLSRPPSNIGELKRELDEALFSAVRSEVSLAGHSPRMCGSIRSLRTRPL